MRVLTYSALRAPSLLRRVLVWGVAFNAVVFSADFCATAGVAAETTKPQNESKPKTTKPVQSKDSDGKKAGSKEAETKSKDAETKPAEKKAEEMPMPALLLLDSSEKVWSLQVTAGAKLVVQKGNIIVDSTHEKAIWNAAASIEAKDGQIGVVGGWFHLGEAKTEPEPFIEIDSVSDPLAKLKLTTPENVVSGKQWFITNEADITLRPGIYRGGVFAANSYLKLEPGVYVVEDGNFFMSNCTVEGRDVTFVMTGEKAGAFWTAAQSQLDLSAPTEGEYKNLVVVSRAKGWNQVNLGGGAKARFSGTIYSPEAGVEVAHGSEITADRIVALNLNVVASTLELTGVDKGAAPEKGDVPETKTQETAEKEKPKTE